MKWINLFKKAIGKNSIKESKKIVDFNEIISVFENKRKEIKDKEKEILISVKDKISITIKELNEKVKILESSNIESIKAEDRVKLIVKGNLNNYINYTKNLTESLYNSKEESLEELIIKLNDIFLNFNKRSHVGYQKATFLIGDEMVTIKEITMNFYRYLERIFNKNKDVINSSKIISFIKLNLNNLDKIKENAKILDEKNKYFDKQIKNIKETNKNILEEIEKIKKSSRYIENLKKQEEIKSSEKELRNEINNLKQLVDLKALANIFHGNKKKWDIIKDYKDNFQTTLEKDNGVSILNLLEEANLNNETIPAKIKQINNKKKEIIKNKETIERDKTKELFSEMKKTKLEIENLNNEKSKELKKYDKLKMNREKVIDSIEQEWAKIK